MLPRAVTAIFGVPHLRPFFVEPSGRDLNELVRMVEAGQLWPVIQDRFPLAEAAAAQELSAKGHVRGKLVLDVTGLQRVASEEPG